jgi:NAD+ kinase
LVVHPQKPVQDSVRVITENARRHGATVVVREADAERLDAEMTIVSAGDFLDRVDAVMSLGGDGTMLGAMRLVVGRSIPVLGVNHGNLGFLVEVTPAELETALDRMVRGDYTLEPHGCLEVEVDVPDPEDHLVAFNDIVVTSAESRAPATVDLVVNGSRYGYYRGDAVIVCTPTGSTAYNYAAGGPIVSPSAPAITVTPVAPMSGISRSVVLGAEDVVALQNPSDITPLRFLVDGSPAGRLCPRAVLSIRLRPEAVNIVRMDPQVHAKRTQIKLSLLDLPLRPDQLIELIPQPLREQAERLRRFRP